VPFSYFVPLKSNPDGVAKLFLAHLEHQAAHTNPATDVVVDGVWGFGSGHGVYRRFSRYLLYYRKPGKRQCGGVIALSRQLSIYFRPQHRAATDPHRQQSKLRPTSGNGTSCLGTCPPRSNISRIENWIC
jgi:hypothetical protein